MSTHPQSKRLVFGSLLIFIEWIIIFLMVVAVILTKMDWLELEVERSVASSVINIFIVAGILAILMALPIKCLNCGKRLLLETESKSDKHFRAVRYPCLNHWASIVVDCLFKRKITCMYCGEEYETKWR